MTARALDARTVALRKPRAGAPTPQRPSAMSFDSTRSLTEVEAVSNYQGGQMAGEFTYIEIPTDDAKSALEFYGSLFGWQFREFPGPGEYHMAQIGERQGAALTAMEPGKRGARSYFIVDDARESAERVRGLGGTATEPAAVPNMGWFSNCTDPHGNEFGIWEVDSSASTSWEPDGDA